ncbi:MAG: hypothetical protein QXD59_05755, partial [Candidatus Caldarchaeum sp.]
MALAGLEITVLFLPAFAKSPSLFLFIVSTLFSLAASFGTSFVVAFVIQREKSEGSFRALRALPISPETLFLGTVLAGVIASILAFLPLYVIATIGLILLDGGIALRQVYVGWAVLLYVGWAVLLISFLSASFTLTLALCVNSPTVLSYLLVGLPFLIASLSMLMSLFEPKLPPLLESRLEKLFYFMLSLEGQILATVILIMLSVMILYVGSRIFSRKKS